jgi:hypothetical protein
MSDLRIGRKTKVKMNKYKKFIWGGIAVIAIGGFALFNANLNLQNDSGVIYKANIEALAIENEPASCFPNPSPCGGPDDKGRCQSTNCINCKDNYGCQ